MDAAACIGCGACVAACPNGSAALFTGAKLSHLALLPQGQPERSQRVVKMVAAMDGESFGSCTMHRECQAVCPKEISVDFIARMNREYLRASLTQQAKGLDTVIAHVSLPENIRALQAHTRLEHIKEVHDKTCLSPDYVCHVVNRPR